MFGDLTVWNGTKEVIIFRWYERLWRWIRRTNSTRQYQKIAIMFHAIEKEKQRRLLEEALDDEPDYRRSTTGSHRWGLRSRATDLRESATGEDAGVRNQTERRATYRTQFPFGG